MFVKQTSSIFIQSVENQDVQFILLLDIFILYHLENFIKGENIVIQHICLFMFYQAFGNIENLIITLLG